MSSYGPGGGVHSVGTAVADMPSAALGMQTPKDTRSILSQLAGHVIAALQGSKAKASAWRHNKTEAEHMLECTFHLQ